MTITIFGGGWSGRIWASRARPKLIRTLPDGTGLFQNNGLKEDVTDQAIAAVEQHIGSCTSATCRCLSLRGSLTAAAPIPSPEDEQH